MARRKPAVDNRAEGARNAEVLAGQLRSRGAGYDAVAAAVEHASGLFEAIAPVVTAGNPDAEAIASELTAGAREVGSRYAHAAAITTGATSDSYRRGWDAAFARRPASS